MDAWDSATGRPTPSVEESGARRGYWTAAGVAVQTPQSEQAETEGIDLTAQHDTGRLTTHVLDTARGCPASGIEIVLRRVDGTGDGVLTRARTNADGRCDEPLLQGAAFEPGRYELCFLCGPYLEAAGLVSGAEPRFLDEIVIRFGVNERRHYHVPLLLSPFGYSTYRGS